MNRIGAGFIILVMLLLAMPACVSAQGIDTAEIDRQVDKYFRNGATVGGSVVIAQNGQIIYSRDYGYASKGGKIPVTEQTYFRVASITKMISAISIMQLYEQGRLDLDADISAYFGYEIVNPYYPMVPITLRQCMSHTTTISQGGGYAYAKSTIHSMLSKEARRFANFKKYAPGTAYSYSNFGGGLMGAIMESVSGMSVNQYMTQNVFAPLGIDAAFAASLLVEPGYAASVYGEGVLYKSAASYIAQGYEDFADPERHYRTTIGSLFIRSRDMVKLLSLLCGDGSYDGVRILSRESAEMMRMDQRELGKSVTGKSPYGLCVNLMDNLQSGKRIYGHQGMAGGAICNAYYDPQTQFTFVLFTNGCSQVRQDRISLLARRLFAYTYDLFAGD